jgi:4-methyl-5(b-hydroxyethyl)-thiazole monophosphate biosynthesis
MAKRVLTILADGFEDIEAVAPIDILTRAGIEVTIAGLKPGNIKGAYGTTISPPTTINGTSGLYDAIVIPGGRRNAESLAAHPKVIELIRHHYENGRIVAAICASPALVLAEGAGIVHGKRVTGDPAFNEKLLAGEATITGDQVSVDHNIVTGQGPGAAMLFALMLVEVLVDKQTADGFATKWRIVR